VSKLFVASKESVSLAIWKAQTSKPKEDSQPKMLAKKRKKAKMSVVPTLLLQKVFKGQFYGLEL
jgi:hypothetical protein